MSRKMRGLLLAAAVGAAVLFLYQVREVLSPFILAAVIAYLANPLVRTFESRQMPRTGAILLVYLIFGVVTGLTIYLVLPAWMRELNGVLTSLPETAEDLERFVRQWFERFSRFPASDVLQEVASSAVQRGRDMLRDLSLRGIDAVFSLFSRVLTLILAPVLAFYILRDFELISESLISLIPFRSRVEVLQLWRNLNRAVAGYVRGQLIISGFVGLMIAVSLAILGIDYAVLIGFFAGLFDIIPYFGPIIGGIPAVLLALTKSPATAVWVVVLVFIAHQIEGTILQPRILSSQVGLHPLTVIFAVLAGGNLLGIWGMLMAVPVAAALKVIGAFFVEKLASAKADPRKPD